MQIQEDKPYDDINITPMLDLAYVLLVIFILMCTASVQGMKATLPHASNTPPQSAPKHKMQAVLVSNDGHYQLNTVPVTLPELTQKLTEAKNADPDVPVVIRGDSATPTQAVVDALTVASNVGIPHIALATKAAR